MADSKPSGCGLILGISVVVALGIMIFGESDADKAASAPVASMDTMDASQRAACAGVLREASGPRSLVEHSNGSARVNIAWWGGMKRDEQTQLMNLVACSDFGARLPGIRGNDQIVAIYDSATNDTLAMAMDGQRIK